MFVRYKVGEDFSVNWDREEFEYLLTCSNNPGLEVNNDWGTGHAVHTSPLNWVNDRSSLSAKKWT